MGALFTYPKWHFNDKILFLFLFEIFYKINLDIKFTGEENSILKTGKCLKF